MNASLGLERLVRNPNEKRKPRKKIQAAPAPPQPQLPAHIPASNNMVATASQQRALPVPGGEGRLPAIPRRVEDHAASEALEKEKEHLQRELEVFRAACAERVDAFYTKALRSQEPSSSDAAAGSALRRLSLRPKEDTRPSPSFVRRKAKARMQTKPTTRKLTPREDAPLREHWPMIWQENESPAWERRVSPSWGGLGYHYDVLRKEEGSLHPGWEEQVEEAAFAFDQRHEKSMTDAKRLLTRSEEATRHQLISPLDEVQLSRALFAFQSNRFSVQPLRLDTNILSPRATSSHLEAQCSYEKPLALASGRAGGPLIPVYERLFADEVFE
jgi:hypothetical protein